MGLEQADMDLDFSSQEADGMIVYDAHTDEVLSIRRRVNGEWVEVDHYVKEYDLGNGWTATVVAHKGDR